MYFRRIYLMVVIVIATASVAFAIWNELYASWRSYYTLMYSGNDKRNLIQVQATELWAGVVRSIAANSLVGLPVVRLYVSQKSDASLMSNLPDSIKKWQQAYLIYPDGKERKVKVRLRGDNPDNWSSARKSWRLKTSKTRMIDDTRNFNFVLPNSKETLLQLIDYEIHRRMGLPTPDARLVELFINNRSYGVYLELEQLDENFLRRRNIMPVNLYKGEQQYSERQIMIDAHLFDNPQLWKRLSSFNYVEKADFGDLENLLTLAKAAETLPDAFEELTEIARFDEWAAFAAFQTFTQSWHNDSYHNMRLISDPWRGIIFPIAHDTTASFGLGDEIVFDKALSPLLALYNGSSRFLLAKHRLLKKFTDAGLLTGLAADMKRLVPKLTISESRDIGRHFLQSAVHQNPAPGTTADGATPNDRIVNYMPILHETIRAVIHATPDVTWANSGGMLKLVVSGFAPVGGFSLEFEGSAPRTLAWDTDMDGRLSKGDMILPVKEEAGKTMVEGVFYANRFADGHLKPAAFNIVGDTPMTVRAVTAKNALTGTLFAVRQELRYGATPTKYNVPVVERPAPAPVTLDGTLTMNGVRVFDAPVTIAPGTVLRMTPGASLVFLNVLTVAGSAESPVRVMPTDSEHPWGVFAILGQRASGSRINHLHAEGGSGGTIRSIQYTGMVSVHDAEDIVFDGIKLGANKVHDDTMHIVYGRNIFIRNSTIENAFGDGIDSDISQITVSNTTITASGNDAIDLMSSRVLIIDSRLIGSGDKGVSVGEATTALVINALLKDNDTGIASKDGSHAYIVNSDMIGNKTQVNAHFKNWRYGTGGYAYLNKVSMQGARNLVTADKTSNIRIDDSTLSPRPEIKGRHVTISDDNGSEPGDRKARRSDYAEPIKRMMRDFGAAADPSVRGRRQ